MHTKGPYRVVESNGATFITSNLDGTETLLARMSTDNSQHSNAHLLASSPGLLTALKEALDIIQSLVVNPDDVDLDFIKYIIAEAEGEDHDV